MVSFDLSLGRVFSSKNGYWVATSSCNDSHLRDDYTKKFYLIKSDGNYEQIDIKSPWLCDLVYDESNNVISIKRKRSSKFLWREEKPKNKAHYVYRKDEDKFENTCAMNCSDIKWFTQVFNEFKKKGYLVSSQVKNILNSVKDKTKINHNNHILFLNLNSFENMLFDCNFYVSGISFSNDGLTLMVWGNQQVIIIDNPL